MRLAFCVFLCAANLYYQRCSGLNFIDLPGFGSDEKHQDIDRESRQSSSKSSGMSSDDSDSDKKEQNREQSLDTRRFNELPKNRPKAYENKTQDFKLEIESSLNTEKQSEQSEKPYPPVRSSTTANFRRKWFVSSARENKEAVDYAAPVDDKDENIKSKISMLVQQTMHDTEGRIKTVQKLKDRHRHEASYRVGFILSMIKKSRDVLNELFNVAVKHRDEWKALEQLKIFELIVHTNVDTTNLVRQLVEMHIQNLNSTAHNDYSTEHSTEHPPGTTNKLPPRAFRYLQQRAEDSPTTSNTGLKSMKRKT